MGSLLEFPTGRQGITEKVSVPSSTELDQGTGTTRSKLQLVTTVAGERPIVNSTVLTNYLNPGRRHSAPEDSFIPQTSGKYTTTIQRLLKQA